MKKRGQKKHGSMKFIGRMLVPALLILGIFTGAIAAESQDDANSTQKLESMTVVGKTLPKRADLKPDSITNLYRVEASGRFGTEVFTQEDIQNLQPSDMYDLLDKAIGINVTYQGRRSPFHITQRGGGKYTYIIDGAVLPPSVNRILYKFPLAAIEEMQIIRGSTSLTMGPSISIGASSSGSGLNTGFIIIRTRQPRKTEATLTASMEKAKGGHPAATDVSLYAGTRLGNPSGTNGYIGGLLAKMNRPSKESWFDGRDYENGMISAGFTAGKFNMNLMGYKDSGRLEMQRGIAEDGTLSDVKWYYDPLKANVFSSDMGMQWTPGQTTLLNLFRTEYEQYEHNENFASTTASSREYEEDTKGFGLRHNARFGNTLIQLGGQMSNSTGFGPNCSKGYNKYDTTVTGWSASLEQKFLNGNLIFDGGYRQDTKHIDNSSSAKSASAANDDANNDVDMAPAKIFALGAHWRLSDIFTLDGRYYHGDQGTSGDFDIRMEDDATPHAEKQERMEITFAADVAPCFKPALTWFNVDVENAKSATSDTYDLDSGTYYYYSESDELRRGLELLIKGTILKNTTYKASWTRMLDNESTSNGVTTDSNGLNNPENLYSLALSHRWDAYRANFSIKRVDEWVNTRSAMGTASSGGLGGYTRIDANIKRDFKFKRLLMTLTLYGRNLGDENYSTRYVTGFYPDRGRTIGTQVAFAF